MLRGAPEEQADPLEARIREWAGTPSLRVKVRKYSTDKKRLAAELQQASLVLLPSRSEGFGLVGLEAIAAGVPILVSGESGLGELLEEVFGEKARHNVVRMSGDAERDEGLLAAKIDFMLLDREAAFSRAAYLRNQLQAEGKTWAKAIESVVELIHAGQAAHHEPDADARERGSRNQP